MFNKPDATKLIAAAQALTDEAQRANALALIAEMDEVQEGIGDNPIFWRPTPLKVTQAMTDEASVDGDYKSGDFIIGNKPVGKSMNVYVLRTFDSRAYFDEALENKRVVCSSPDAKDGWRYGDCRSCVYGKYVEGQKTPCRMQKSFWVISTDFRHVCRVDLSRTALNAGREWESRLRKLSGPLYRRQFELNSRKHEKHAKVNVLEAVRTDLSADDIQNEFLKELFAFFAEWRKNELVSHRESVAERAQRIAAGQMQDHEAPASVATDTSLQPPEADGIDDATAKEFAL